MDNATTEMTTSAALDPGQKEADALKAYKPEECALLLKKAIVGCRTTSALAHAAVPA